MPPVYRNPKSKLFHTNKKEKLEHNRKQLITSTKSTTLLAYKGHNNHSTYMTVNIWPESFSILALSAASSACSSAACASALSGAPPAAAAAAGVPPVVPDAAAALAVSTCGEAEEGK
jgi:hypothetical protein